MTTNAIEIAEYEPQQPQSMTKQEKDLEVAALADKMLHEKQALRRKQEDEEREMKSKALKEKEEQEKRESKYRHFEWGTW